jgi:hypothetical protein
MTNPASVPDNTGAEEYKPDFARADERASELRVQWEKELGQYLEAARRADLIAESDLSIRVNTVAE